MTTHFQSNGGIASAHLVNQLAGNGQSIDNLAFITSLAGGNLELLARGGAGTFVKLNYLDAGATVRTGLAITTGTSSPVISVAPEANGAASLDLENNDLTGVENVVPSPDNRGQLNLDGLLALTPQPEPTTPAFGGVLYVDAADGALAFVLDDDAAGESVELLEVAGLDDEQAALISRTRLAIAATAVSFMFMGEKGPPSESCSTGP